MIFPENKLVVATYNQGKRQEIEDLLAPYGLEILFAPDLGLPDPVEDGLTLRANALIKAQAATDITGLAAIGDDSGMAVTALNGAPGVYSARWAYAPGSVERDFGYAMERVQQALEEVFASNRNAPGDLTLQDPALQNPAFQDRSASFNSCLCLTVPGLEPQYFEGKVEGELVWPVRGPEGFGYDPMFVPSRDQGGDGRTFGEMSFEEKQNISHRKRALAKFLKAVF